MWERAAWQSDPDGTSIATVVFPPNDTWHVTHMVFYGPPTRRWKRFLNWCRRLVGRDPQDEVYLVAMIDAMEQAEPYLAASSQPAAAQEH